MVTKINWDERKMVMNCSGLEADGGSISVTVRGQ